MGRGRKTGGRDIRPGQVLNPLGAGAHNKELKALRRMTREEVAEVGTLILDGNIDALQQLAKNPQSSVLKVWFASVALTAIKKGDASALSSIMDRIVGKPQAEIKLSGGIQTSPQYTPEEAQKRFEELQRRLAARELKPNGSTE